MADELVSAMIDRLGRRRWEEYLAVVKGFWQAVRSALEHLGLDYQRVHLYQDGLPVCGRELELVRKAAAGGSQNHQLLLDMIGRGADLVGTEDPKLLLEEYRNVRAGMGQRCEGRRLDESAGENSRYRQTLAKRDAYIGRRIGESLRQGRTGIVFLGIMHEIAPYLPGDIVRTRLAPRVPGGKDQAG